MPLSLDKELTALREEAFADFTRKLVPTVPRGSILGVRTPQLRQLAKAWRGTAQAEAFLRTLPHRFFEENQLHAFLLGMERDFKTCLRDTEAFLPFIDNWAVCDQLSPSSFRRHRADLLPAAFRWIQSGAAYTARFGIKMLMDHFLDEDFRADCPEAVAAVCSGHYYVKMMQAWYFATALAKQYESVFPFIAEARLDKWVHNMTLRKAVESRRIPPERKEFLKTFRLR